MKTQPRVSVITIFLNAESFIRDAIESVLSQTYKNFELWLVDDGSTDQSLEIAQWYAQKNPQKIQYLAHPKHQNLGMSASRNLGIAQATGDYIALLDADDRWLPRKLEKQVNILVNHPEVAMVFNPSKLWHSWTGKLEDREKDRVEIVSHQSGALIQPPALFVSSILKQQVNSASTCSLLVRRTVVEKHGGFEPQFQGLFEDQVFLTKIYSQEILYAMAECLDLYRQHPGSCVSTHSEQTQKDTARLGFLGWVEAYLQQQQIDDPTIWSALNETVWPYQHPWLHRFQEFIVPLGRLLLPRVLRDWLWQQWSRHKQPNNNHRSIPHISRQ